MHEFFYLDHPFCLPFSLLLLFFLTPRNLFTDCLMVLLKFFNKHLCNFLIIFLKN